MYIFLFFLVTYIHFAWGMWAYDCLILLLSSPYTLPRLQEACVCVCVCMCVCVCVCVCVTGSRHACLTHVHAPTPPPSPPPPPPPQNPSVECLAVRGDGRRNPPRPCSCVVALFVGVEGGRKGRKGVGRGAGYQKARLEGGRLRDESATC